MILLRKINGSSMTPTLEEGDLVLALPQKPRVGQIAIAQHGTIEIIKRVAEIKRGRYYLLGDNSEESTDSRHYGSISKKDILGTIMIVMPRATSPPTIVGGYGVWLGRIAALLLIMMALVHLFRIDTFIPLLDEALPGGSTAATLAALAVILTEIFAIPFALRMKLSPLAHLLSGALMIFAPVWWVAIDILTIGISDNTAQLGEFMIVPSTALVLGANLAWLTFNYLALYSLGYNNLKYRPLLRK